MNFHSYTSGPVVGGVSQASYLNNQALARSRAGDHAGAEVLHKQALEIKINSTGPNSIQAALSYNALGETQLKLGKFDEAEESLSRAVEIRENGGPGAAFDAAVSKENLAQVYEAKGLWEQARQIRTKVPNQMVCSNYNTADWRSRHKKYCKAIDDQ
ncbi:hypothetical protein FRC00_009153 [Tulasnella sp. 408]|nr:hypothetical protein FRC00_009153 [Tulasnella sp. 408]